MNFANENEHFQNVVKILTLLGHTQNKKIKKKRNYPRETIKFEENY